MKAFIPILLLLISCARHGSLPIQEVKVVDDKIYQYKLYPHPDSIRIYNPGKDTFQVTMTFEKLSTGFPLPTVIQHVDGALNKEYPVLIYTPQAMSSEDNIINPLGWTFTRNQISNVAHYQQTLSILATDGWVDFPFTGFKIEYYAEQQEGYGIVGVSIDGAPETMVDLYSPTNVNNSNLVFTSDSLDQLKPHTIRLRYTGQHNPNTNTDIARINLDKFVVYIDGGTFYPEPPPSDNQTPLKKRGK